MEKKNYNVRLPPDLMKEIRILAAEQEKRQTELVEEALRSFLTKHKKRRK